MTGSSLQTSFSITDVNALFKTDFKQYADDVANKDILLWSQIKKKPMTGKQTQFPVPFGYAGGASSGRIGEAKPRSNQTVTLTHKKVYQKILFDRDAVAASMDSKGAFAKAIKQDFDDGMEAHIWNMERILFGSGDGKLGTAKAAGAITDNGGGNYDIIISDATWKTAVWEEGNFVNIESGNTDLFEITDVDPDNKTITVQRADGDAQIPANADEIFLQQSEDNDPTGIKGVIDATAGTLYGITVGRRWKSYQDTDGGAISYDRMNDICLAIEAKVGRKRKTNLIIASYVQFGKLQNQAEEQKRYSVEKTTVRPKDKRLAEIGFSGLEMMTTTGAINIVPSRFVEDDRIYFLNTDYIHWYEMPKSGWVADDGRNYLRVEGEDQFSAYLARYGELYVAPTYQGVASGLSTT